MKSHLLVQVLTQKHKKLVIYFMDEKVKRIVKAIIPLSVRNGIRSFKSALWKNEQIITGFFSQRKSFSKYDGDIVVLIGVPEHGNLGDQAIAFAEKNFLSDLIRNKAICYITEYGFYNKYLRLKQYIRRNPGSIILWHGGGNIGEIYKFHESMRLFAVKHFHNTKLVILPQTIDYTDDSSKLQYAKRIYNKHPGIVIFARERESYIKAKNYFSNCLVYMVPDIVLTYRPFFNEERKNHVLLCIRNDEEIYVKTKKRIDGIVDLLKKNKIQYAITDTCDEKEYSCEFEKQGKKLFEKWKEFASSRVVITDRLHGMIFALITNTPCIALDNSTGKVSSFYHTWLEDSKVLLVENDDDLNRAMDYITNSSLKVTKLDAFSIEDFFKDLISEIS